MSKLAMFSVVVVLLAGTSVFGQGGTAIDQIQNTVIGLGNTIQLLQGHQAGDAIQNLAVCNGQSASRACGSYADQSLLANFAEIGHASGDCAIVQVLQALTSTGMQTQLIGDCCDGKVQCQTLNLGAEQGIIKSEGPGAGSGLHQIVNRADQFAINAAGTLQESSSILGLQSADLTGSACATGTVNSTMCVSTVQTEATL
jgi:hypothetical protein